MDKKAKTTITILSTIAGALIVAMIVLIVLTLNDDAKKVKKQLELGQKYIEDMDYEEAIACFDQALEIDPLSVDAYEGKADAYIAMEDYESAKDTLEGGIKVLEKAAKKEDDDDKVEELNDGIEVLNDKLEVVDGELDRIAKEEEAARLAKEEEERRKAEEERLEAERKAEEERIAALPYVEFDSVLMYAKDVWGRNWDAWTEDDFRREMNIQKYTNGDGEVTEKSSETQAQYEIINNVGAYGIILNEWAYNNHSEGITGSTCKHIAVNKPNDTYNYWYYQMVLPNSDCVITDTLYYFTVDNGVYSTEDALNYFGLDDDFSSGEETIEINSDYGLGTATLYYQNENFILEIALYDVDNPEIGAIEFRSYNNSSSGEPQLRISLKKNK